MTREAGLAQTEGPKDGRVLAGHGEEGVGLGRGQLQHGGDRGRLVRLSWRHRPRLDQGLVFLKHSGRLQPVSLLVADLRQLVQVEQVRPHPVHVLFERDVFREQLPGVILQRSVKRKECKGGDTRSGG